MNLTPTLKMIFKVFIPAFICALIIYFTQITIEYYPLSFGIVVGLAYWNYHKYNLFVGVILSLLASYVSFFIAYFSTGVFAYFRDFLLDNTSFVISDDVMASIGFTISPFIIAPLLVFFFYKFVFNIPRSKLTYLTLLSSIIILVSSNYLVNYLFSHKIVSSETLNIYMAWQVVMVIALGVVMRPNIKQLNN